MRSLLLLILWLVGLGHAQGPPASPLRLATSRGAVTTFQSAVALRGAAGQLIWRRDLPVRWIQDVQVAGGALLVAVRAEEMGGVLILDLKSGLLTGADTLAGASLHADPDARGLRRGWGLEGERFWWVSTSSGAYLASQTRVVDLTWGLVQTIRGAPFARQGPIIFFIPSTARSPLNEPERLDLIFWDTRTAQSIQREFIVAARPGCGNLVAVYTLDDYGNRLEGPTYTAMRRDDCGLFRAQFKWAESEWQSPAILPAP